MKAKDTVMSDKEIGAIMQPCVSPTAQGIFVAKKQAEITYHIAFEEGKQAGIKEVVDKVEAILLDSNIGMGRRLFQITEAIAQLKKRGIK